MAIRKNDAIIIGLLVVSNLLMPILGTYLKGQHPAITIGVQFVVVIGLVGLVVIRNWKLKVDGSGYDIFRIVLVPPGTVVDIPVRREWKRVAKQNPRAPWLNVSTVDFAEEMKIDGYGEHIQRAHLTHYGKLTDRLISTFQSNVQYKGDEIEHNTVYIMTCWQNDMYPVSQEQSMEEPNWILISSGLADQSDEGIKNRTLAMALGLDRPYLSLLANQPKTVKDYIQIRELENERLLKQNLELHTYIPQLVESEEHWRIESIKKDGKLDAANQEITGMIGDNLDVKKAGERRIESKVTNIDDVYDLKKESSIWKKFDWKWIVIGLSIIAFILYLQFNPKIIEGITKSITPITAIVILAIVAVGAYFGYWLLNSIRGKD